MPSYVALLRAVNVGGTGKLPMVRLRAMAEGCGFSDVATYIQSGNLVFRSKAVEAKVRAELAQALTKYFRKSADVLIRTQREIEQILQDNPFPEAAPNRVQILFLPKKAPADALDDLKIPGGERVVLHGREIYAHFPNGMGQSKLKLPFADVGTARNLNTVAKLASLLTDL